MSPAVTVLMPAYNAERYIHRAIMSILGQDLRDLELLVIDDASTDRTPAILAELAAADSRIAVLRNDERRGITTSLNRGLLQAQGPYVARLDADDLCLPGRLTRQADFMERHQAHMAIGCGFELIDADDRVVRIVSERLDDWQVRWLAGFNPPAPHSTAFFRRLLPDGTRVSYDEAFRTAQDFDLWSRLSEHGKLAVLPDVLVQYRRHAGAITVTRRREQALNCRIVGRRNLARRLPAEVVQAMEPLLALFAYEAPAERSTIASAVSGCQAMLAHDLPRAPTGRHRRWVRRLAAGLLADAILSRAAGLRRPTSVFWFLVHARWHLLALLSVALRQRGAARKSLASLGRVRH